MRGEGRECYRRHVQGRIKAGTEAAQGATRARLASTRTRGNASANTGHRRYAYSRNNHVNSPRFFLHPASFSPDGRMRAR